MKKRKLWASKLLKASQTVAAEPWLLKCSYTPRPELFHLYHSKFLGHYGSIVNAQKISRMLFLESPLEPMYESQRK